MKSIWLARDKNGELWGYLNKPIREEEIFIDTGEHLPYFSIYDNLFPEITWENSPVEFIQNREQQQQEKKQSKHRLQVDDFDTEFNALLKKYEHLPREKVAECLRKKMNI